MSDKSLDFAGIKFINPMEYHQLPQDQRVCISLAQTEILAINVRVYQVDKNFTGAIKGNIAAVGRESFIQEIDKQFTPDSSIPYLMIHDKKNVMGNVAPGDEVVINYENGIGKVIPVATDAKYVYDIKLLGNSNLLNRVTEFLNNASQGGKVRLTSERIAEVIGGAITNAHSSAFREFNSSKPEHVIVGITEHIKTLDLKQESIRVSEKLLDAYDVGYRVNKQESTAPQVIFVGAPKHDFAKPKL